MRSRPIYAQLDLFQKRAAEFVARRDEAGLFFGTGTGKTWIAGAVFESELSPTYQGLVIGILANIDSTWLKFLRNNFPNVNICGTLDEFLKASLPRILAIHAQVLTPRRGKKLNWKIVRKLMKIPWNRITLDESHRIKEHTTQISKALGKLGTLDCRRLILSATPLEDQPTDLWAQFRFLAPSVLGTVWKDFEDEYLEPIEEPEWGKYRYGSLRWKILMKRYLIAKHRRKFNQEKLDQFMELIGPYVLSESTDVLNLPPMDIITSVVKLDPDQRELYDELETKYVVNLGEFGKLRSPVKIGRMVKLQRITGGFVSDDEDDLYHVGDAKIRDVRRHYLRERHHGPIVIGARFREELLAVERMLRRLPGGQKLRIEFLVGGIKRKERLRIQTQFQKGKIDVLLAQEKAGGVGIDLFYSNVAMLYSATFSSIDFDQFRGRIRRRGQTRRSKLILITAEDTIDEDIFSSLRLKGRVVEAVMKRLRRKAKKGNSKWRRR